MKWRSSLKVNTKARNKDTCARFIEGRGDLLLSQESLAGRELSNNHALPGRHAVRSLNDEAQCGTSDTLIGMKTVPAWGAIHLPVLRIDVSYLP